MNLFKIFRIFLIDQIGVVNPIFLSGGAMLGGNLLGAFSKPKQNTIDPFGNLRQPLINYSLDNLDKSTPYSYNPEFELPQPEIENETENKLLGRIRNPSIAKQYSSDVTDKYYKARKARLADSFEDERTKTADMYNRLGLVSSTPGLKAMDEVNERQRLAEDEISSGLMYEDIDREFEGLKLAEDINLRTLGAGLGLGGAQRGYSQFPIEMSFRDVERRTQEEQALAQMIAALLTGNPPQTYFKPSFGQQIGQGISQIGQLALLKDLGAFK